MLYCLRLVVVDSEEEGYGFPLIRQAAAVFVACLGVVLNQCTCTIIVVCCYAAGKGPSSVLHARFAM